MGIGVMMNMKTDMDQRIPDLVTTDVSDGAEVKATKRAIVKMVTYDPKHRITPEAVVEILSTKQGNVNNVIPI